MTNNSFIDINVCLDFLLKRKPFAEAAGIIFQAIRQQKITAFISAISFDTMFYVLRPAVGPQKATALLHALTLHTHIAMVNEQVILHALKAKWRDLDDAIQYHSAVHNGCDVLVTRNQKDFTKATLPVLSPQEFLAQFSA